MERKCWMPRVPTASSNQSSVFLYLFGKPAGRKTKDSEFSFLNIDFSWKYLVGAAEDFLIPGILKFFPSREKCQGRRRGHKVLMTNTETTLGAHLEGTCPLPSTLIPPFSFPPHPTAHYLAVMNPKSWCPGPNLCYSNVTSASTSLKNKQTSICSWRCLPT